MTDLTAARTLLAGNSPDQLVRELRTLPPVPKVMMRLQPLLANCNSNLEELASVIRLERALAARVLQMSNSVYLGVSSRACSIEEAVTRLGFREVRRLVTVVIGMQMMERPLPAYGIDARELWRQSVACALAAEQIAGDIGEDPGAAYTLGLLHSVGMVVVNAWVTLASPGCTLRTTGYSDEYTVAERELLGFTNADTGAALLRKWEFSPSVVEPVRAQYQPVLASASPRLAHLLVAARWLRSTVCSGKPPAVLPDVRTLEQLDLTAEKLQAFIPEAVRRFDDANRLLTAA